MPLYQITKPVLIHLQTPNSANEFIPHSLGAGDLVMHKTIPLSACLMQRQGKGRNLCIVFFCAHSYHSCYFSRTD